MSSAQSPMKFPKFVAVEESGISSISKPDGFRFSLVSYNILAQVYVRSSQFPHSPAPSRKWKARSEAILSVLRNLGADFLCLQELDEYESFYKGNIESSGYSSTYIQRSGKKRDGCGIFYKPDVAELVLEEFIVYNDLVNSVEDEKVPTDEEQNKDPDDSRVRLKRDCVGVMAAFTLKGPSYQIIIVANTHIYWDPNWADVKLAQVKYLLSRLGQFKSLVSDTFECTPSVIVAGDFNSTPGNEVYQYLVSGNASTASTTLDVDEDLPISLCSTYASTIGHEPPFTSYTPKFKEPESSDIVGGLPNFSHPSDHLPIGSEFVIFS